jgi:hypothetical protein
MEISDVKPRLQSNSAHPYVHTQDYLDRVKIEDDIIYSINPAAST